MKTNRHWFSLLGVVLVSLFAAGAVQGQTFTVLHQFQGFPNDGRMPSAPLIEDAQGNLYGTTLAAGQFGSGIVFKLNPSGTETVLHNFTGGTFGKNGTNSYGLARDAAGNLYGTTMLGGDLTCDAPSGCGAIFKLDPSNRITILHRFHLTADGAVPNSGLVWDTQGNLYGSTGLGGDEGGGGTVFKINASTGHLTNIRSFPASIAGNLSGSVTLDAGGNLYGAYLTGSDGTHAIVGACTGSYRCINRYRACLNSLVPMEQPPWAGSPLTAAGI
jgi:uncharacterized repeat protein (TIGR03803 family)